MIAPLEYFGFFAPQISRTSPSQLVSLGMITQHVDQHCSITPNQGFHCGVPFHRGSVSDSIDLLGSFGEEIPGLRLETGTKQNVSECESEQETIDPLTLPSKVE